MVIAVDFDGTLCESCWPEIGRANEGLIEWLRRCRESGDKLILWTCREEKLLDDALAWCRAWGLEFDSVNDNLPERIAQYGNNCRKVGADIYLDDKAATPVSLGWQRALPPEKWWEAPKDERTAGKGRADGSGRRDADPVPEAREQSGPDGWWNQPTKVYSIGPVLQKKANGKADPRRVDIENGYIAPWKRGFRSRLRWCWAFLRNKE